MQARGSPRQFSARDESVRMSSVSAETSQKIKNMSVICALLVVMIHVGWSREILSPTWFVNELVKEGVARIAVPFFFVVSGYFLAAHFDEEGWWRRETKKRIHTLVIPFLMWSIIAYLALLPIEMVADHLAHRPFGTSVALTDWRWAKLLGIVPWSMPRLRPLWYVRALFILVLLSPLIKMGARKFKIGWLLFWFIIPKIVVKLATSDLLWNNFFMHGLPLAGVGGMFYFSLGVYLRSFKVSVRSRTLFIVCAVCGAATLIAQVILRARGMDSPTGMPLPYLRVPALMYAVWYIMPSRPFPEWLTACAFPIYVMHIILLRPAVLVLKYFSVGQQTRAILTCLTGMVLAIAITNLLRKFAPRVSNFLFAGRVPREKVPPR